MSLDIIQHRHMSSTIYQLTQSDGYGLLIGLGIIFTGGMIITTMCLRRYRGESKYSSETFSTADRKVKTGLIASAVVSSWTWAATLLHSSSVTYSYGVSGSFWYASGATVQIILFCIVGIELKRRAPHAHTFLELVNARYGKSAHLVFIVFCLGTNVLVTSMLLTGGAAAVHALCGIDILAACFLLPIGTIIYTMVGGIKATFLTDYAHTTVILIVIFIFTFAAYAASPILGSPSKVYDLLVNASQMHPVEGNVGGSYLTMRSTEGALFFIINIIGNFGTVFVDNGYYNKAIAASPVATLPGYVLGGIAWLAVPFLCSTAMGLAAVALESNPAFPTYPNRISPEEISAGLPLVYAAVALLGKNGAILTMIMIFMAVTSALSAQLIAVSSIVAYDLYRTYINPEASGERLILVSHMSVASFGIGMSIWCVLLYYMEISMGYLYLLMGIIISSAVIPGILSIISKQQSNWAVCLSPLLGLFSAIIAWLVTTKVQYGVINIQTSESTIPMLIGNLVALLSPILFVPFISFIKPDPSLYDFASMKTAITLVDDRGANNYRPTPEELVCDGIILKRNLKIARIVATVLTICLTIIWPWPMYGSSYIFSKEFFTFWVIIGILWLSFSFTIVSIYPLVENRRAIVSICRKIYIDLTRQRQRIGANSVGHISHHVHIIPLPSMNGNEAILR